VYLLYRASYQKRDMKTEMELMFSFLTRGKLLPPFRGGVPKLWSARRFQVVHEMIPNLRSKHRKSHFKRSKIQFLFAFLMKKFKESCLQSLRNAQKSMRTNKEAGGVMYYDVIAYRSVCLDVDFFFNDLHIFESRSRKRKGPLFLIFSAL
jgi:hypothetical protein